MGYSAPCSADKAGCVTPRRLPGRRAGWQSAQNVRASLAARSAAGAVVRQGESFHFAPVLHCRAGEASDGEEGRLGEGRSTCEPRGRRRRQGGLALLVQDLRSHFWGGEGASFGKQDAQVISVSGATATPGGFCISPAGSSRAAVVAEARRSGVSSALRSPLRLNAAASRMFRCRRYPVSALVDWVEWRRCATNVRSTSYCGCVFVCTILPLVGFSVY